MSVFIMYMRSIGVLICVAIIVLYILNNIASVYANFWLSDWSNDKPINGTFDPQTRDMRLGVYGALGMSQGKISITILLNDRHTRARVLHPENINICR